MKKCKKSSRGWLPWRLSCSLHMTIINHVFREIWTDRLTKQTSHCHRNPPSPALRLVGVNRAIVIFYLRCTHTFTHIPTAASPVWSCRSLMWKDHPLSHRDCQCSSQTDNCLFWTQSKTTHTHTNIHILLFKQCNAYHCSWSRIRMSNTLTLRRFRDVCCTANLQDKGVRVDGRVVGVKMDEDVSKERKTDNRQKISQRR